MGKSTISMVIFNSYFDITRGYVEFFSPGHFPKCLRVLDISNAQEISPRCARVDGEPEDSTRFGKRISKSQAFFWRNMTGLIFLCGFCLTQKTIKKPLSTPQMLVEKTSPGTKVTARPMAGPRDSICVRGTIPSMNFSGWLMLFQTQIRMIRDI